ncbi:MAG: hypothetical protein K9G60_01950 [Pseudolabrys sp.]|nr:hypothetical protein [Pseudolabrys sp.]
MKAAAAPRAVVVLLSVALLALGACARVVETKDLKVQALGYSPTCHSTLGAYHLPRALLRLKVTADAKITSTGLEATTTMVADRAQTFCLDFLSLPTTKDIVTAQRDVSGLLSAITSEVEDRSPVIAASLTAIGENIVLQGRRSLGETAQSGDSVNLEFDPFIWRELDLANKALHRFGFCLYVEGYSFPTKHRSSGNLAEAAQRWCERPYRYEWPGSEYAELPVAPDVMQTGVLYRPNATHKVVIMRKSDPGRRGAGGWKLFQTKRVEMPNVSPVLSIGVDRATFASRKTTLKFNRGVLTDVAIDKTSELAGFVSIPLGVAKAIVDVPAQIIQLRIADTGNEIALLNAQSQLIDAIASRDKEIAGGERSAGGGRRAALATNTSYRTGLLIGGCRDAGGGDACNALLTEQP